jgi:hypothetical protein
MKPMSKLSYLWHNFGIHAILIATIFGFSVYEGVWQLYLLTGTALTIMLVGGHLGYNRYVENERKNAGKPIWNDTENGL